MSRLADQVKQALAAFKGCKTPPALIGGLALAVHEIVRATRDVDFLADAADADHLHAVLTGPGYQCRYRNDAANYVRAEQEAMEQALKLQKSFWKFIGVLMIVLLSLYVLIFIGAIAFGLMFGASHLAVK